MTYLQNCNILFNRLQPLQDRRAASRFVDNSGRAQYRGGIYESLLPFPRRGADCVSATIRLCDIYKRYPGGEMALHPLSFSVEAGEIVVIMGPNGAGKTTLCKILATLVRPDGGDAWIAGHPLHASQAVRRSIGMVSDPDRSFFWRLNARQNLDFFARGYGLNAAARRARIADLLAQLQLGGVSGRPVGQLSSGQRGRLALARALLHRPPVLLLDEPTRSLDPTAAAEFLSLLQDYLRHMPGASILLATHRLDAVAPFCRRLVVLAEGRLRSDGPPEMLLHQAGLPVQPSPADNLARLYMHFSASEEPHGC